jgi:hypothetical protein
LTEAVLVGVDRAEVRWAFDDEAVAILRGHRLDRLGHVLDQRQSAATMRRVYSADGGTIWLERTRR